MGWGNFSHGMLDKQFTITMTKFYNNKQRPNKFIEHSWTKQMIIFILSSHIEEWYNRCNSNSTPNQISFRYTFMSLEKYLLLSTIDFWNSREEILPVDQKRWFNSSVDEFKKLLLRNLKQWISSTKKLFKVKTTNNNYSTRKMTDYLKKKRGNNGEHINRPDSKNK